MLSRVMLSPSSVKIKQGRNRAKTSLLKRRKVALGTSCVLGWARRRPMTVKEMSFIRGTIPLRISITLELTLFPDILDPKLPVENEFLVSALTVWSLKSTTEERKTDQTETQTQQWPIWNRTQVWLGHNQEDGWDWEEINEHLESSHMEGVIEEDDKIERWDAPSTHAISLLLVL